MHECYDLGIIDHDTPWCRSYGSASSSGWVTIEWRNNSSIWAISR
jgi:hypothetical protein